jgi:hypothetical protein
LAADADAIAKEPDFIDVLAAGAVGTAVALRQAVTVRWSDGNPND